MGYCSEKIKLKEFLNHENAPGREIKKDDFDGIYRWEIVKPKINWSYRLEWEWSDQEEQLSKKKIRNEKEKCIY